MLKPTTENQADDRAVSPVIGVILMVAITVILAAVIGTFVLDIGQSAGQTAPQASLSVDLNTNADEITVSHEGGDAIDAANTRVIIVNESSGNEVTWDSGASSDTLAVGQSATFTVTSSPTVSGWSLGTQTGSGDGVTSGHQYTVRLIDTQSQRQIYETTVTAL